MRTVQKIFWLVAALSLVAAGLLFALDWQTASAGAEFRAVTSGELWHRIHPPSLNLMQAIIERYLLPSLWSAVVLPLLLAPASLVALGKAAFFALLALAFRWRAGQRVTSEATAAG